MPIRLNLLAETQAIEDLRRRNPVKRAIWVGVFLVFLMLLWSSSLQLKAMIAKSDLARVQGQMASRSNSFAVVMENQNKLADISQRLTALRQLAGNRFLNGTALNSLQQATVDEVLLTRFRAEEGYTFTEAIKAKGSDKAGKPAMVTERIAITLDARDVGANPGDQINNYKQKINDCTYFRSALGKTNEVRLLNYLPPQIGQDGKPFVLFTLECRFPDNTR